MKKMIAVLLVGLVGGAAGGWFGHEHLAPQLGLEGEEIEALIVEERADDERLVLTIQSEERTLLISFMERRHDVASLVAEGDTILVRVPRSGPIVDDPPIVEVRRAEGPHDVSEPDAEEDAADDDEEDPESEDAEATSDGDDADESEGADEEDAPASEEVSEAPSVDTAAAT